MDLLDLLHTPFQRNRISSPAFRCFARNLPVVEYNRVVEFVKVLIKNINVIIIIIMVQTESDRYILLYSVVFALHIDCN
jgi:hypothetical protein